MVIFLLAAISAYFFARPASLVRRVAAISALLALGIALYAEEADSLAYPFLQSIRHFASHGATAHALLGAVAGVMLGVLPAWVDGGEAIGSKRDGVWRLLLFTGGLAGVVLIAWLAPFGPALLDRTTGVETPYLKVQFATSPAEKQQALRVERDLVAADRLEDFSRSIRFINFDCGQAALERQGMANFKRLKQGEYYKQFEIGILFRKQLLHKYVNRMVNAQRSGKFHDEFLKANARIVADRFAQLVSDQMNFDANYGAAWSEIGRQDQFFKSKDIADRLPKEEEEREKDDRDPDWCNPPDQLEEVTKGDISKLINETRYVHAFAAALYSFVGNSEREIWMSALAKGRDWPQNEINVNSGLAGALYAAGRDFSEFMPLVQAELSEAEEKAQKARNFVVTAATDGMDARIRERLLGRYDRIRTNGRLHLAYLWAQQGSLPPDPWPLKDVPWATAKQYAEEARRRLLKGDYPEYRCTDDDTKFAVNDIYAYVQLAFEAHNLQSSRTPPDQTVVREARTLLEEVRADVAVAQGLYDQARPAIQRGERTPSCLSEIEIRAWNRRISNHLNLAEAMLR